MRQRVGAGVRARGRFLGPRRAVAGVWSGSWGRGGEGWETLSSAA